MVSGKQWFVVAAATLAVCGIMATAVSAESLPGAVYAWGWNSTGQLGDGTNTDRLEPVVVPGLEHGVTAVSAGTGCSFAIQNGTLFAWGRNDYGRLGIGISDGNYIAGTPQLVHGSWLNSGVTAISSGLYHNLAIKGGKLYTWGWNSSGQLGDGTYNSNNSPQFVPGAVAGGSWVNSDVTVVFAGPGHNLAIRDGTLYAWGDGSNGNLGDGTWGSGHNKNTPQPVLGMWGGVTAAAAGSGYSLAIQNGALYAWGNNANDLWGTGNVGITTIPQPVLGMESGVTTVATAGNVVMAIKGGKVYMWGWNITTPGVAVDELTNIVGNL